MHCSAGVGRTGSFCVLYAVLTYLPLMHTGAVDVIDIMSLVRRMRASRRYMVQTVAQYQFCYEMALFIAEDYVAKHRQRIQAFKNMSSSKSGTAARASFSKQLSAPDPQPQQILQPQVLQPQVLQPQVLQPQILQPPPNTGVVLLSPPPSASQPRRGSLNPRIAEPAPTSGNNSPVSEKKRLGGIMRRVSDSASSLGASIKTSFTQAKHRLQGLQPLEDTTQGPPQESDDFFQALEERRQQLEATDGGSGGGSGGSGGGYIVVQNPPPPQQQPQQGWAGADGSDAAALEFSNPGFLSTAAPRRQSASPSRLSPSRLSPTVQYGGEARRRHSASPSRFMPGPDTMQVPGSGSGSGSSSGSVQGRRQSASPSLTSSALNPLFESQRLPPPQMPATAHAAFAPAGPEVFHPTPAVGAPDTFPVSFPPLTPTPSGDAATLGGAFPAFAPAPAPVPVSVPVTPAPAAAETPAARRASSNPFAKSYTGPPPSGECAGYLNLQV